MASGERSFGTETCAGASWLVGSGVAPVSVPHAAAARARAAIVAAAPRREVLLVVFMAILRCGGGTAGAVVTQTREAAPGYARVRSAP
jgi:hypothetical protein